MNKDFYGINLEIGDVVSFPSGANMMDGTIEKFRGRNGTTLAFVRNTSGNKKWKYCRDLINRSSIERNAPQLFV